MIIGEVLALCIYTKLKKATVNRIQEKQEKGNKEEA